VVLAFISTGCQHCQAMSMMYQKIYSDLKDKGFQMIDVAFVEPVSAQSVAQFSRQFGITFPVGIGQRDSVLNYLGIPIMTIDWMVPQIVVIDKKGVIREQSQKKGTAELQENAHMRAFIDSLMKEGTSASAPTNGTKKGITAVKRKSI
jgi:peroxiredoxin